MNEDIRARVLIVDDDRLSRQTTILQLRKAGFVAEAAEHGYRALELLAAGEWDVVVSDLRMPGIDGLELLRQVRERWPRVDVIVMTAFGTVETALSAMRAGAADYLVKPFRFEELETRLCKLTEVRACKLEIQELRAMLEEPTGLVGQCPAMRRVLDRVSLFADQAMPVLVTGETGTGKELVAQALHRQASRRKGPFVPVPCGAIPHDLAESELFGHERGAFTGASTSRAGAFQRAHTGTLLLDDVDDLPLPIQAKLLRVLQDGTFTRLGGTTETTVDVRVVATTKVELEQAVASGSFRDDLMYRLRALEIQLPPLRQRGDDILTLALHFVHLHALRADRKPPALSPEAARLVRHYRWPGNVRELGHAMASALAVCAGDTIEPPQLPDFVSATEALDRRLVTLELHDQERVSFTEVVHQVEQELVQWAMTRAAGQQTKAAELLGLPRTTFQSKLGKGS